MSKHKLEIQFDDEDLNELMLAESPDLYDFEDDEPKFPEYHISELPLNYSDRILIVGGSESGKSTVARNLLREYWKSGKIIMTFWYGSHHQQENYLPAERRSAEVNKQQIEKVRAVMKKYFVKKDLYSIIVLDDINGEGFTKGADKKFWERLFTESRHENIIIICCVHNVNKLTVPARQSVNRWIITRCNVQMIDQLYKESCAYGNKKEFRELILGIQEGTPVMMDLSKKNNGEELKRLIVDKLDSEDM